MIITKNQRKIKRISNKIEGQLDLLREQLTLFEESKNKTPYDNGMYNECCNFIGFLAELDRILRS